MGSEGDKETAVSSQLISSVFDGDSTDNNGDDDNGPLYWLQYKPEYKGVWFSYEYYDVDGQERDIETCHQLIKVGKQKLLLLPYLVHRVDVFYRHFMSSIEANPLLSPGRKIERERKRERKLIGK